ncbi:chromo domain protein LHP1-like [Apium graveolens]|uniref:chromo domain protein LHP1-like n=1 Tax=Apium graveolens TaxID=4045 RepID=UPI003D79DCAA
MNGDSSDTPPAPEQNGIAKERERDERENKEVDKNDDKAYDQMGDLKKQQEGQEEDAGGSRPKLAEGFYEIEAVRRKRVRKGQVQYYIKWRGWPETANTWEPYDNLAACYDVIETFEESLRSGKHRSRKRKRRSTGPVPQVKKKPQGNTACTSRAPDAGKAEFDEGNFVVPSLGDQNHEDGDRSRMGDINSNEAAAEQGNENHIEMDANCVELMDAPSPSEGLNRLPVDNLELKASEVICLANGHHKVGQQGALEADGLENGHHKVGQQGAFEADGLENGHHKVGQQGAYEVGQQGALEADGLENGHHKVGQQGALEADGLENGHQKVDREGVRGDDVVNGHQKVDKEEIVKEDSLENGYQVVDGEGEMQAGARSGNRKRKPALVKRFNQTKAPCVINYKPPDLSMKNTRSGGPDLTMENARSGVVVQNRDQNSVHRSNDLGCKSKPDDIIDVSSITEIVKPISFSSSESAPDILVTFMAKRSDGKEVIVDNKYLKANNPLLLISYYEQHLNYNTATGPPRLGRDSML